MFHTRRSFDLDRSGLPSKEKCCQYVCRTDAWRRLVTAIRRGGPAKAIDWCKQTATHANGDLSRLSKIIQPSPAEALRLRCPSDKTSRCVVPAVSHLEAYQMS